MGLAVQSGLYVEKIILLFFLPRCRDGSRVHNLIIANFMPSIVRLSFCELFVFVAVRSVFRHIGVCNRLGPCVEKICFFVHFVNYAPSFSSWSFCECIAFVNACVLLNCTGMETQSGLCIEKIKHF